MTLWTCATCAVEHPDTAAPPAACAICADERQWVPPSGQRWTTRAELAAQGCAVSVTELEPGLHALRVAPRVGIGHRGLLVATPGGNLLWDPPGYLDEAGVEAVRDLGGLEVIASSHPHLTGSSVQWSHAFGDVPVLVAAADAAWVRRPDPVVELWSGVREVLPGVTLVPCGGHFAGSAVAHWAAGAGGSGVLLTGDTIMVGGDGASVSAMRSYVNDIPLPERAVRRILAAVEPYPYDRLHSGFSSIGSGARGVVETTLERYVAWLRGDVDEDAPSRSGSGPGPDGGGPGGAGALDVARRWQGAVDDGDAARVRELSAGRVRVAGPRGATVMAVEDLDGWMERSGFSARPRRWFTAGGGTAVADQRATWRDPGTRQEGEPVAVATRYRVIGGRVVAVTRHGTLATALADAGLTEGDAAPAGA